MDCLKHSVDGIENINIKTRLRGPSYHPLPAIVILSPHILFIFPRDVLLEIFLWYYYINCFGIEPNPSQTYSSISHIRRNMDYLQSLSSSLVSAGEKACVRVRENPFFQNNIFLAIFSNMNFNEICANS